MTISSDSETQVNTNTDDWEGNTRVTMLEDGGWVVSWSATRADSTVDVFQQAYYVDGTVRGTQTLVNSYIQGSQINQSVASLEDGGWVVTWSASSGQTVGWDVHQQVYNVDGTARGVQTLVNTTSSGEQRNSSSVALADGGWVVSWVSNPSNSPNYSLYQQAYNADGTVRGGETQISSASSGGVTSQQSMALSDGGWVTTWASLQENSRYYICQQAFNADGTARGEETILGERAASSSLKVTALQDGGWLVSWVDYDQLMKLRTYDADGTARDPITDISTGYVKQIVTLPGGGFVLTWSDSSTWPFRISQQVYDADGAAIGGVTKVNTTPVLQLAANVVSASLADGGWVTVWRDAQDGAIYQQAFNADGTAEGSETKIGENPSSVDTLPKIIALPDGAWIVTWVNDDIHQRIFWRNDAPTVVDPLRPVFTTDGETFSYTVPTDKFADADAHDTLTYSAALLDGSALPDWLQFDPATRTFSGSPGNDDIGHMIVNVIATDKAGSWVASNLNIFIDNVNDAPTVADGIADQVVTLGGNLQLSIDTAFEDVDVIWEDVLTYGATLSDGSDLPEWLEFDTATGIFSGSPGTDDLGPITIRVTAMDRSGEHVSTEFTLTVNDVPVVANAVGEQVATEEEAFSFTVPADTFDDEILDTLTYCATLSDGTDLPEWLAFDPATRTFSGTPANGDAGSITVRLVATDAGGATVHTDFALEVENVNDAPTVASPIGAKAATEDLAFSYTVPSGTFADIDAGDVLTYSAKLSNGSTLPSWLSFNAATRTFSGTPANGDVGSVTIRLTARDAAGATVSTDFTLSVANVNDAPTVPSGRTASVFENATVTLDVLASAADVDVGDTLTITTASVRSGFGSVFIQNGKLVYDPTTAPNQDIGPGETRTVTIRYTVSDGKGGTATTDMTVTVKGISGDIVKGTTGNDTLSGTALGDTLHGYAGNDTLDGKAGADRMEGSTGNDTYVVDNTGDTVVEKTNEGTDLIRSSVSYTLAANVENLTLTGTGKINGTGNELANVLTGNDADNTLDGKAGADRLIGLKGNDTYVVDNTGDVVVEAAGQGTDLVKSSVSYTLAANVEHLTLTGTGIINATGNELANVLTGNDADNTLDGKAGTDRLVGLKGNDTYIVDNTGDVVVESANQGIDQVMSSISYTLGSHVEAVALTGTGKINATGNELDNVLDGNGADNVLDGKAGADLMRGGKGNDTYVVDNANDLALEAANQGTDLVRSSISYTIMSNIENLTLTGTGKISAIGNESANTLTGNDADNTLDGKAGADRLVGLKGNDTYIIDNAKDVVVEGSSQGTDLVKSSVSYTLAANVENLTLTGTGKISATGNELANTLTGNDTDNTLDGKAGADRLVGLKGNDTYIVDNAKDVVVEGSNQGTDLIKSSVGYALSANVENLTLTGTGKISGSGNELANTLTGNDTDNTLDGKAGADRLVGLKGNDTYVVDNAKDVVVEGSGQGTDLIKSSVSYTLSANVESLTLTGTGKISGSGNELANTLTGNSTDNTLDGKAGNDTLKGEGGNDRLIGGLGADRLYGGAGTDTFVFKAKTETTVASSGMDMIYDFSRSQGDRIDLSAMDANEKASGNQTFTLIGTDVFHKKAGELRYETKSGDTYVYGDVDGDGNADFAIRFDATLAFKTGDFLL